MAGFGQLDLWRLAGPKSYERGERYVDAVVNLRGTAHGARATVHGREPYRVRLSWADGGLSGDCSCPVGQEGAFCKHCVAVGLTLVDLVEEGGDAAQLPLDDGDGVREYLTSLDREALVGLLCEHADRDEGLYRALALRAARDREVPDAAALRREIDNSLRVHGYIDYDGSHDYGGQAGEIISALDDLLEEGHAAEVIPLARRVIDLVSEAMEHVDDSSGYVGAACEQAAEVHARACAAAPPEPAELAQWLLGIQLDGPGWPALAVADYADALGEAGMRLYREEVESRWQALPAPDRSNGHRPWAVTHMMEELATLDGADALVAVLATNLSSPWQYVRIVSALAGERRHADALEWAERGLREHENAWSDQRLVDAAVEQNLALDQLAEAVEVRQRALRARPTFDRYRQLRELGGDGVDHVRARGLLRGAELVRALLADGEHDLAWDAAQDVQCSAALWQELAERRAAGHPLDAAAVFRRLAAGRIEHRNNDGYAAAATLIARVGQLYERAGQAGTFAHYLDDVKIEHRRKRNFMAALAAEGL